MKTAAQRVDEILSSPGPSRLTREEAIAAIEVAVAEERARWRDGHARPKRIQRKRTKGWRMPPGAIYVGRGSRWGNPYRIGTCLIPDARAAVEVFAANLPLSIDLSALRGHDLACWCPLVDKDGNPFPCHADVLLEIANR